MLPASRAPPSSSRKRSAKRNSSSTWRLSGWESRLPVLRERSSRLSTTAAESWLLNWAPMAPPRKLCCRAWLSTAWSSGESLGATWPRTIGPQRRSNSTRSPPSAKLARWWLRRLRIQRGHWGERIRDWVPSTSWRASTSNSSKANRDTTARLTTARSGSMLIRPAPLRRSTTGSSRAQGQIGSSRGRSIQRRSRASRQPKPGRRRRRRSTRRPMSSTKMPWNSTRSYHQKWSVGWPVSSIERQ